MSEAGDTLRSAMPTVEVTIGRLREAQKRQIAQGIGRALIEAGIPRESIRIIFRHIGPEDVAVEDGRFPYWSEGGGGDAADT